MTVAAYFYYEMVRRTMRTAIVSYLLKYADRRTTNVKREYKQLKKLLEDGVKTNIVYNLSKLSQYLNVIDTIPQKYIEVSQLMNVHVLV